MTITVDWVTQVISIEQADLTPLGGSLYELDIDDLRLALKALEATPIGMSYPDTHSNTAPAVVGGVTLARVVLFVNGYTIVFEDDQYGVNIVGGNSNLADVLVRNQVSVNTANSAGLVLGDGGFTTTDRNKLNQIRSATGTLLGNA
jgi:hypothetical protein